MSITDLSDWKSRSKFGALSNLNRADAIFAACRQLEFTEDGISQNAVREMIGGGSIRDINPIINLYRQQAELRQSLTHTPETLVQVIAIEIEKTLGQITEQFSEQAAKEQALFSETAETLSTTIKELEDKIAAMELEKVDANARMEQMIEQSHQLNNTIDEKDKQFDALNNTYQKVLIKNDQLETSVRERTQQIEQLQTEHKNAIQAKDHDHSQMVEQLNQQHEKESARLMTVHGNERGEWQRQQKQLDKQLTQLQAEFKTTRHNLEHSQTRITELTQHNQSMSNELLQLSDVADELDSKLVEIDNLRLVRKQLIADNQRLLDELDQQKSTNEQLSTLQRDLQKLLSKTETKQTKVKKGKSKQ